MADLPDAPDVLRAAAALVRSGWCVGAFAKDAAGKNVSPNSNAAIAWDVFGSVCRAAAGDGPAAEAALRRVDAMCGEEPLQTAGLAAMEYNDRPGRTAEEVADLMERAAIRESLE